MDDTRPGYIRCRLHGRFVHFDTHGGRIRDPAVITHIDELAIPPAYTDIWICSHAGGHLQAAGHDTRGRKQYRYYADWYAFRSTDKYGRLLALEAVLPWACEVITAYLEAPGLLHEKVLATVVYLLDVALVCMGNATYACDSRSYGLTTLRNRHVKVHGNTVHFQFCGESGVGHDVSTSDPRLVCAIRHCVDLPRQELFQHTDETSERRVVDSMDVNAYLQETSGVDFMVRDYRTQAGSVLVLDLLRERTPTNVAETHRQVVEVAAAVAQHPGNTPAVYRKCYVYPTVADAFPEGELEAPPSTRARKGL